MLDAAISVVIAGLTAFLAGMGIHVTLHPIIAGDDRRRKRYKRGFGICALTMIGLIYWQSTRNQHEQEVLNAALLKIERNTQTPPKVDVHVPPAQVVVNPPATRSLLHAIQQRSLGPCSPNIIGSGNTQNCNVVPHYPNLTMTQQSIIASKVAPLTSRTVIVFTLQNGASYETVHFADQLGSSLGKYMHVEKMPMLATVELPEPSISVFLSPKDQDLLDAFNAALRADRVITKNVAFKYGPPDNTTFQILVAEPAR